MVREFRRSIIVLSAGVLMLMGLDACATTPPRPDQVPSPAVGTLVPGGHEEAVDVALPPGMSGVLFANQTNFPLRVIVNNTSVTIPSAQDFKFILPPGEIQFYVYESGFVPRVHTEKLDAGKLRYVYWSRRDI